MPQAEAGRAPDDVMARYSRKTGFEREITMDDIGGMLGGLMGEGGGGGDIAGAIGGLVGGPGGLQGLIDQLGKGGLGEIVGSWVGVGPNRDVEPKALADALGQDQVSAAAARAGLPIDQFLPILAAALPTVVDAITPHGKVPEGDAAGGLDIGGLLEGLGGAAAAGPNSPLAMLSGLLGGNKG